MKIEVLQEQLLEGISIASRAVAVRAQLPVLSHILIEAKNEGVVLSSTDLELAMQVPVSAKVIESGVVAVPAKMFSEFLGTLNPGKIELQLEKDSLVVTAPGYRGRFQTIGAEEFPSIPRPTKESLLCSINARALSQSVSRVAFASAKDTLRPVLTGVLWEIDKKRVRLVATDGFRLAIEELSVESSGEAQSLLVPSRVVLEVVRLAGEEKIEVGYLPSTNQIYFVVRDIHVVSQLLSGKFPDYQKIMPKGFGTELSIQRDELLQAIKAAHIFARDNSNMVRWQVEEGKLVLLSTSPERGECRVEVPIKLSGESVEIIFNARYVLDYLSIVEGQTLWIGMGGKLSPGMIKDESHAGGQYIVMPINA